MRIRGFSKKYQYLNSKLRWLVHIAMIAVLNRWCKNIFAIKKKLTKLFGCRFPQKAAFKYSTA